MTAAIPDFAKERGISPETLTLFNVRVNGSGWLWDTKCLSGGKATRWKSFYSTREKAPEDEQQTWKKYTWYPERPKDAQYFYPPNLSFKEGVEMGDGDLWLVGGEVAAMSMLDAGYRNVTSFFGDSNIPDTLVSDLKKAGVTRVRMIPDRDESGQACAMNVRDLLKDSGVQFIAHQLPYPLEPKHGKDVNDYWLSLACDAQIFLDRVDELPEWALPEPQPKPLYNYDTSGYADTDLPVSFIADIERSLDVYPVYNADGWSKRNVPCPFHDDVHASATWNHNKAILRCHAGCGKSYLAKEVGGYFGLTLSQYFNPVPVYSTESTAPKLEPAPVVIADALPEISIVEKAAFRPALPASAELTIDQRTEAKKGRKWLDTYVKWACEAASATPEIFHEAMGLWLLATAATRRVKVQVGGEDIFPNLYIMIIAKTSLYRKSTGMKKAAAVLNKTNLDVLKLPAEATPEALFDELAGIKPANFEKLPTDTQKRWMLGRAFAAQRSIMKDEASSILANLKKEYMAGLSEILLQGYDSDAGIIDKRLQSKGVVSIKDLSLCFLGATTPVMYAKYIGVEENENGFLARFALITPEGPPVNREAPDYVDMPYTLVQELRHMFLETLPGDYKTIAPMDEVQTPPVTCATVAPDAFITLKKYRNALGFDMIANETVDDSKAASYSRLGTMAYKVALLLATVEATGQGIRIEDRHAYAAILICERWRESLHRLDVDIARSQNNGVHEKVFRYIQSAGEMGVTLREIMKDCGLKTKAYALDILSTIAEEGTIARFERKPEGKGRPTVIYKFIG